MVSCNHHSKWSQGADRHSHYRQPGQRDNWGPGKNRTIGHWSCLCKSYHPFSTHMAHASAFHVSIETLFSSNYFMLPTTLHITNKMTDIWPFTDTLRWDVESHWWLIGYQTTVCVPCPHNPVRCLVSSVLFLASDPCSTVIRPTPADPPHPGRGAMCNVTSIDTLFRIVMTRTRHGLLKSLSS